MVSSEANFGSESCKIKAESLPGQSQKKETLLLQGEETEPQSLTHSQAKSLKSFSKSLPRLGHSSIVPKHADSCLNSKSRSKDCNCVDNSSGFSYLENTYINPCVSSKSERMDGLSMKRSFCNKIHKLRPRVHRSLSFGSPDTNPRYPPSPDTTPRYPPSPDTNPRSPPSPDTNPRSHPSPDTNPRSHPSPDTNPRSHPSPDTNPRSHPSPNTTHSSHPSPDTTPGSYPSPDTTPGSYPSPDTTPGSYPSPNTTHSSHPSQNTTHSFHYSPGCMLLNITKSVPETNSPSGTNSIPGTNSLLSLIHI